MIRIFNHYIPKWSLILLVTEGGAFFLSVYAGLLLRFLWISPGKDDPHLDGITDRAVVYVVVMLLSVVATGRYQRILTDGVVGEMMRLFISFLFGVMSMSLIIYIHPEFFLGRGAFLFALILSFAASIAIRWFFHYIVLDSDALKRRVVIVGAGKQARIISRIPPEYQSNFVILGYIHLPGHPLEVEPDKVITPQQPLSQCLAGRGVDEVVIALDEPLEKKHVAELLDCKMSGITILDTPGFFEKELRMVRLEVLEPAWWMLFSEGFGRGVTREVVKRLFDVLLSLTILALSWPIMLSTAAAIWVESGFSGTILFRQWRVGLDSRPFQVMKFRSMRPDAEHDGVARWAKEDDDRITRVGAFIRKMRIDELPQIINVLKGEMSLVGPRPERPEFVEILAQKIPYYVERHRVKPGITGWAQICYGYGASEADAAEKLKYDLYYVKNHSLFLDVLVLIQSVEVVLFGNARHGPRSW